MKINKQDACSESTQGHRTCYHKPQSTNSPGPREQKQPPSLRSAGAAPLGAPFPLVGHSWRDPRERLAGPAETGGCTVSNLPCPGDGPVILPEGLIELHATPLPLGKVRLPKEPDHAGLGATDLEEENAQMNTWTSLHSLSLCASDQRSRTAPHHSRPQLSTFPSALYGLPQRLAKLTRVTLCYQ